MDDKSSTFKTISVRQYQSVILAKKTGAHGETIDFLQSSGQSLSLKVYQVHLITSGNSIDTLVAWLDANHTSLPWRSIQQNSFNYHDIFNMDCWECIFLTF